MSHINLFDIDKLIENFITTNAQGIKKIHSIYYKTTNDISLRSLKAELVDELKTGCVTFINKGHDINTLNQYLFYIVNDFCKRNAVILPKKKIDYLCPGCLSLGRNEVLNSNFQCYVCESDLKVATDPKKIAFLKAFHIHSKSGYRCPDCNKFIPNHFGNPKIVTCPYLDCFFVGESSDLKKMHHPALESNPEKLVLDASKDGNRSFKDNIVDRNPNALEALELKEEISAKVDIIRETIESQNNSLTYNSSNFTIKHKQLVYQAFSNLLRQFPVEMVEYLLGSEQVQHKGFQHKIFQKYVLLLENDLPFTYKKANKTYKVESLLDTGLNLFDGISTFDSIVTDKSEIKNETKEFYIGGRKATYSKPYYIGKLLNVIDTNSKSSIIKNVTSYSFSRIKLKEVDPGTLVTVTHLRVPPHYQMGGMVHVNRIRKKIVDRATSVMNKDNYET